MVFSSLLFLFMYLPIVLLIYYAVPFKFRNLCLFLANLVFYGWGEPVYIVIMFASIAIDYTHGLMVERCKARDNDRGARMAVASSVGAFLLLNFAMNHISVAKASIFSNFTTVISVLAGILILHDSFSPLQLAGIVVITLSVCGVSYRKDAPAKE